MLPIVEFFRDYADCIDAYEKVCEEINNVEKNQFSMLADRK